MNPEKNNDNLDNLITNAIGRDGLKFDFDKWKNEHEKEVQIYKSQVKPNSATFETNTRRVILWRKVGYIAAAILIISSLTACLVLSKKVSGLKNELALALRDTVTTPIDDSVNINFYLREHQDVIAKNASLNMDAPRPIQIHIDQDDLLYYEFLEDGPEYMRPGIIVRRPSFQRQISSPETPAISNGHTLTLSEARETTNFDFISPLWFRPCFKLDQIIKIEGRDTLQFLYTDEINSVSLFEQPLGGDYGLEPKDFREYAVYRNQGQSGSTILAWRDNALSYVLIGNIKISQLMDMTQSISTTK